MRLTAVETSKKLDLPADVADDNGDGDFASSPAAIVVRDFSLSLCAGNGTARARWRYSLS
jgi:hypothetical protein